jgi:propanol-preferring alcohol dehydrogenase
MVLGKLGTRLECLQLLLCAGLIGWRSLLMAGTGKNLGLYGFGASAHILA